MTYSSSGKILLNVNTISEREIEDLFSNGVSERSCIIIRINRANIIIDKVHDKFKQVALSLSKSVQDKDKEIIIDNSNLMSEFTVFGGDVIRDTVSSEDRYLLDYIREQGFKNSRIKDMDAR